MAKWEDRLPLTRYSIPGCLYQYTASTYFRKLLFTASFSAFRIMDSAKTKPASFCLHTILYALIRSVKISTSPIMKLGSHFMQNSRCSASQGMESNEMNVLDVNHKLMQNYLLTQKHLIFSVQLTTCFYLILDVRSNYLVMCPVRLFLPSLGIKTHNLSSNHEI